MKKICRLLFLIALLGGALTFSGLNANKEVKVAEAATQTPGLPAGGHPGSTVFINGCGTYFNDNTSAVLYCWNSTKDAFSDKGYKIPDTDIYAVTLPSGGTWNRFIVCRYNNEKNPAYDRWDGVYNKSADGGYGFSETFVYYQNYFSITGWDMGISDRFAYTYTHYGIESADQTPQHKGNQIYLDLSSFKDWEVENAKFAIYFANPMLRTADAWSSFMTKVEGTDNDHLYECAVPNQYGYERTVWNLVIPVRFSPVVETPDWYGDDVKWNQTNDIRFDSSNHEYNVLKVTGWGSGEIKSETITRAQRVDIYGQYFLDTVNCSGHGNSDGTTEAQWNAVKNQYQNMQEDYQGDVWLTVADSDSTASKIAQAMARYDYIIFYKEYSHEDFINRASSDNKTAYDISSLNYNISSESQRNSTIILVIISIVSLCGISVLLITKRRLKLK